MRNKGFELVWICLDFISYNFSFETLPGLRSSHDEAVGGFFDAPDGRAANTSFEGANKSGEMLECC